MSFLAAIAIGFREIFSHKFRSFLSMLGVVLGVSSLIATMALTRGIEEGMHVFMQQLGGLELVSVVPNDPSSEMLEFANLSPGLTLRDAHALRESATLISHISPEISLTVSVARDDGGNSERLKANGILPDHFVIRMHELEAGRWLTDLDIERGARCAVIGQSVADQLWPGSSAADLVGRTILLDQTPFRVVGVLPLYEQEEDARARKLGQKPRPRRWDPFRKKNEAVLIPFSTMFHEFRSGAFPEDSMDSLKLDTLSVRIGDLDHFRAALGQVRSVLDLAHRGVDDYDLETREDWFNRIEASALATRLSGGLISAISLIVGGIGIMNIMLASISERIREFGIRLAVGARPRDIFRQILVESMLISLLGGLLGVVASLGLIEILKMISPTENVPVLTTGSIVFSVAFALASGLLSGLYPASKAAHLDPITALRYE
ncbi:MAG: ABC transporter permease [Terrimicrobiaceae bacterium]